MIKLKLIVGSTRPNRFSEKVLPWLVRELDKKNGFEVEVLDLREYELPFFDQPVSPSTVEGGNYGGEAARKWAEEVGDADAYLIITPEYNRSTSAVLKNALDTVYAEWNKKTVGFVAYGSVGGARAVEQLRLMAIELQMVPVRTAVHIPEPWFLLDEQGNLKEGVLEKYNQTLETLLEQLLWYAEALKVAREK